MAPLMSANRDCNDVNDILNKEVFKDCVSADEVIYASHECSEGVKDGVRFAEVTIVIHEYSDSVNDVVRNDAENDVQTNHDCSDAHNDIFEDVISANHDCVDADNGIIDDVISANHDCSDADNGIIDDAISANHDCSGANNGIIDDVISPNHDCNDADSVIIDDVISVKFDCFAADNSINDDVISTKHDCNDADSVIIDDVISVKLDCSEADNSINDDVISANHDCNDADSVIVDDVISVKLDCSEADNDDVISVNHEYLDVTGTDEIICVNHECLNAVSSVVIDEVITINDKYIDVVDSVIADIHVSEIKDEIPRLTHRLQSEVSRFKDKLADIVENDRLKSILEEKCGEIFIPSVFPRFENSTPIETVLKVDKDLREIRAYFRKVEEIDRRRCCVIEVAPILLIIDSIEQLHTILFNYMNIPQSDDNYSVAVYLLDDVNLSKRHARQYQLACITCTYLSTLNEYAQNKYDDLS